MKTAKARLQELWELQGQIRKQIEREEELWRAAQGDWMLENGWCNSCHGRFQTSVCDTCNGQSVSGPYYNVRDMMYPPHEEWFRLQRLAWPLEHERHRIEYRQQNPKGLRALVIAKSATIDNKRVRLPDVLQAICQHHSQKSILVQFECPEHPTLHGQKAWVDEKNVDLLEW